MEYGYSCMGYELAGAMGIVVAASEKEVICFVGDGSYMMANSELVTAAMMNVPFTVVLTDNRGYGCIIGCSKNAAASSSTICTKTAFARPFPRSTSSLTPGRRSHQGLRDRRT
jgi:TPP-dependent trihydroxycyclohexane-1,2-dione (THcHDO) dehydratase